jgi:hypothetical protein
VTRPWRTSNRALATASILFLSTLPMAHASQDTRRPEELEEVQVLGRRINISEVRTDIIKTEDRFYALLNQLLDDPEMHVTCDVGPPLGSHLHKRTCGPQFVSTANAEYTRAWIQGIALQALAGSASLSGTPSAAVSPGAAIGPAEITFHRKVNELLESNSDLRDLATRRAKLEILLKAAQKARWSERP